MSDLGSYVWFIGLGAGLVILALAIVIGSRRKRPGVGNPNAAWEQAARESGDGKVAKDPPPT